MKLIAIGSIDMGKKVVQPGESFDVSDEEAARLIMLGAARSPASKAAEPEVETVTNKPAKRSEQ